MHWRRFMPPTTVHGSSPPQFAFNPWFDNRGMSQSAQDEQDEQDDGPMFNCMLHGGLQLRFDQLRKNRPGILLGTSPDCDIVIPNLEFLGAVGRRQCAITLDHLGRLIIQDLREPNDGNSGTAVTYDGGGGTKHRGFTWVLGNNLFASLARRTIVIAFDDNLKFQIVVASHDVHSQLYKEKVAQFRQAVATNGNGLPHPERDLRNPEL